MKISDTAKFVIAKKLVHKIKSILDSNMKYRMKTLCPMRVMVKNFD